MARVNPRVVVGAVVLLVLVGVVWRFHSASENLESQPLAVDDRAARPRSARAKQGERAPQGIPRNPHDFYALTALDAKQRPFPFGKLRSKVVLIVNVAHNDQKAKANIEALQQLQDRYFDQGFTVVAFPCNQFGNEEPGSDEEIQRYLIRNMKVTFPIMARVDVNGAKQSAVFRFLKTSFPGMVKWNFAGKFLINRRGQVIKRSRMGASVLASDIEAALADH